MKTVCESGRCTSCMLCQDICPKGAIQIIDSLSQYDAVIDKEKCIQCGKCYRVCQNNKLPELHMPIYWKEGWSLNEDLRKISASGGLATEIEKKFVKNGGVVSSCVFEKGDFSFQIAETEDDVEKFKGSKYVKSNVKGVYRNVYDLLKVGKRVLFVGLPCQVAALKKYIGNNEKLYTIDLICHGAPSVQILNSYIKSKNMNLKKIKDIYFRTKSTFILKENSKIFTVPFASENYSTAFGKAAIFAESCYRCHYAQIKRGSDITLGDSWGTEQSYEEQMKGISLALCQTEKGKHLLESCNIKLFDVDLERCIQYNHQLNYPSQAPNERNILMRELKKGKSFEQAFRKSYPKEYIKDEVKKMLYNLGVYNKEVKDIIYHLVVSETNL